MSGARQGRAVRYSVLLPTRGGGPFLDACLRSILMQDHPSFEVVVSDNANDDETPAILAALSDDARVVGLRHEAVLSVSENWSEALVASSGQYVLMIGDDDLLLPGTLQALDRLLTESRDPDCLSFNAFRYVAPAAVADRPVSYYGSPYFGYERQLIEEGFLSAQTRAGLVKDAYHFDFKFPLTMQLTLAKRVALERLPRAPFRSAFPDHYAICALLLTARSWFVTDRQLLLIGVSPKSFGHYFLNDQDADGLRYLGLEATFGGRLPGNEILNAQCDWLAETKTDFAEQLAGVDIDRAAYVARQVRHWLRQYRHHTISSRTLLERLRLLSARDVLVTVRAHADPSGARAVGRAAAGLRKTRTVYLDRELVPLPGVADIGEFSSWLDRRGLTPARWAAAERSEAEEK
jgi:glycosyltransferase involved in cell wall biosynthesis